MNRILLTSILAATVVAVILIADAAKHPQCPKESVQEYLTHRDDIQRAYTRSQLRNILSQEPKGNSSLAIPSDSVWSMKCPTHGLNTGLHMRAAIKDAKGDMYEFCWSDSVEAQLLLLRLAGVKMTLVKKEEVR